MPKIVLLGFTSWFRSHYL